MVFVEFPCFLDFLENLFGNTWFEVFPKTLNVRENLAVALECLASVVKYDLVHLENFAEEILMSGAVLIVQAFVFRGQTWMGEQSAAYHHACKLRVASFHFTDVRDACDVAVINEMVATFFIKFFDRLEVYCAFVLVLAESWVERDLRERRFV